MKQKTVYVKFRRNEKSPFVGLTAHKEGCMEEESKLKEFLHKLIEEASLSKLRLIVAVVMEIVR